MNYLKPLIAFPTNFCQNKCLWLWQNFIKSDYLISEKSYANHKSRLIVQWIAQYNLWCSTRVKFWSCFIWYIYLWFFFVNKNVNFYNYADDTIFFTTVMSFEQLIPELENILWDISQWFMNNNLKTNVWKLHFFSAHMRTKR